MGRITNQGQLKEELSKLRTKRGESRLVKYEGKEEPFGLNQNTRRLRKLAAAKGGE